MKRLSLLLALFGFGLASLASARADFFVDGYYAPASGKVGQPLVADAAFSANDVPSPCMVVWKDISVAGALPPGINPPGSGAKPPAEAKDENGIQPFHAWVPDVAASAFFGTPSKAGDWPVTVTFHGLSCSNVQAYGDRVIKVNFHIAP